MQYVGCLAKECLTARCSAHYHRYDLVAELWLPRRKYLHYRFVVVVVGIVGGVGVEYLLPQDKGVAFCYHPIMPIVRPREEERRREEWQEVVGLYANGAHYHSPCPYRKAYCLIRQYSCRLF
jgi:hypothetical protein